MRTHARLVVRYANGTWFGWAVSSQSIDVLAATLEPAVDNGHRELAFLAIFAWALGVFRYALMAI